MYFIDYILDRVTMYRAVLYYLIGIVLTAFLLSISGLLSYNPWSILVTLSILLLVCYLTNSIFSRVFAAPTNVESVYITALILSLVIAPVQNIHGVAFVVWAGVLSIASKYILTWKKKHIFNPVAIGILVTSFGLEQAATWWVGNALLTPIIVIGGLLIVRKTRREDMVISFFVTALLAIGLVSLFNGGDIVNTYRQTFLHSSLLFFGFVMVTEPLTTPPTRILQTIYGVLVGLIFPPQIHVASFYSTPELALVIGNIFSYLVSPKQKFVLYLKEKIKIAPDIYDFIFQPPQPLRFRAGQYVEWTFSHPRTDSRGNRRYFTIASSPTEKEIRLGVKFYKNGSSYKNALLEMNDNTPIVLGQLSGDFVLPKDKMQKLVFVAGGIGITPFRSMLKYLIDTDENRDIVLVYSNRHSEEVVYDGIISEAVKKFGLKVIMTLTDTESIPPNWKGHKGRLTQEMIVKEIPDFNERLFYLSGSQTMVKGCESVLKKLKLPRSRIKKDFFPGLV